MLCQKCETDVPPENWSEYDQVCENCSYIEHRNNQEANAREHIQDALAALRDVPDSELKNRWAMPTLSAAALEAFVAATDADHYWVDGEIGAYSDLPEDRYAAAQQFLNLAKLALLGAPTPVLDYQINVVRKRCGL